MQYSRRRLVTVSSHCQMQAAVAMRCLWRGCENEGMICMREWYNSWGRFSLFICMHEGRRQAGELLLLVSNELLLNTTLSKWIVQLQSVVQLFVEVLQVCVVSLHQFCLRRAARWKRGKEGGREKLIVKNRCASRFLLTVSEVQLKHNLRVSFFFIRSRRNLVEEGDTRIKEWLPSLPVCFPAAKFQSICLLTWRSNLHLRLEYSSSLSRSRSPSVFLRCFSLSFILCSTWRTNKLTSALSEPNDLQRWRVPFSQRRERKWYPDALWTLFHSHWILRRRLRVSDLQPTAVSLLPLPSPAPLLTNMSFKDTDGHPKSC